MISKKELLKLLNGRQIDVIILFERYLEYGGVIKDINQFNVLLQTFMQRYGFESVYSYAMIEYSVHKLYDKEGTVINYY